MRARALAAGYREAPEVACADVVVVNTCSFITEATEEAISTILEVLALPRLADGTARLVVAGCMPSRYGDKLAGELPEVAAFVGCADEDRIVEILDDLCLPCIEGTEDSTELATSASPLSPSLATPSSRPSPALAASATQLSAAIAERPLTRTVVAPWAYVKIADGCDRFCSFCTIPRIRGRYRSVPADEIVAEVAELVASGACEIVLIAQDTGLWGREWVAGKRRKNDASPVDLAALLDLLATRFPVTWLRVMYLQPQGITNELLSVMARHANICSYLDIPLQHANARILREMNREGSGAEYLDLLGRIREALPDVTLRTTVIAGFPGETRAEARELERFIEKAAFDYVGVFAYSREDGTRAGQRVDQVSPRTRRARAQRLRDLADVIGFSRVAARIGDVEEVLAIEYDEDEGLLGRTRRQAPEVDGMVHLDRGSIGEVVSATMVEAYCYDQDGETV
jgi:ribosomal protein S12 methylthiotransferase